MSCKSKEKKGISNNGKLGGTTSCSVHGCGGRQRPMFRFPKPDRNNIRFRQWVHLANNPRYVGLSDSQIYDRGYVCWKHFKSEDFIDHGSCKKLSPSAVPKQNLPAAVENKDLQLDSDETQPLVTKPIDLSDLPHEFSEELSDDQLIKEHELLLLECLNLCDRKALEDDPDDPVMLLRGAIFRDPNVSDFSFLKPGQSDFCPITDEYIYLESSIEPDQSSVVSEGVPVLRKNVDPESFLELDHSNLLPVHEENVGFENSSNDDCLDREVESNRDSENVENQCTLNDYSDISEKPVSQKVMNKLFGEELKRENQCRKNIYSDIFEKSVSAEEVIPIETKKPYFKSVKSFLQDCHRMTEVCRICFQSLEDNEVIKLYEESSDQAAAQLKRMLKLVLPDLDLEIYPNTVICVKCAELLVYSYQLKEKWLSTEEKLQKIIEKKMGVINCDADLVIIGKRGVTQAEAKMDNNHIENFQSEEEQDSEFANTLLQSLGVEFNGKCSSKNVSFFHGNFDNRVSSEQFRVKRIRQKVKKPPEKEPAMCEQCGRMYSTRRTLRSHLKIHNKPPKILSRRERDSMCEICGKFWAGALGLKLHKISHLEKKCSFCDRVFQNSSQLRFHISSEHKRTSYQCHLCGKQYPYRSSLVVHLKAHNSANRNKACHICNKKFLTVAYLRKHLCSHVKRRSLKCEFCGKSLKHRLSLQKHINIWHLNQAKHICEFCTKPYWKKYDLQRHRLRVHKELLAEQKDSAESHEENCAVNSILPVLPIEL